MASSTFENRLATYRDWPTSVPVAKELMAQAGFVYTGRADIVICPACYIEGYRWCEGDDPLADHREWSPRCPWIRNNNNDDTMTSIDVAPAAAAQLPLHHSKPAKPELATIASRLATFAAYWPRAVRQRPDQLADAGFYYTGVGDQTMCFYCNGGLKDWEDDDDPWLQHARWFKKCPYVLLKKGKDYVQQVESGIRIVVTPPSPTDVELIPPPPPPLCKICCTNEINVIFLPCSHVIACVDCAVVLQTCAVCRQPIDECKRAYLS
nr:hypothetical protein [Microctonus hyperodae filamentous virus]